MKKTNIKLYFLIFYGSLSVISASIVPSSININYYLGNAVKHIASPEQEGLTDQGNYGVKIHLTYPLYRDSLNLCLGFSSGKSSRSTFGTAYSNHQNITVADYQAEIGLMKEFDSFFSELYAWKHAILSYGGGLNLGNYSLNDSNKKSLTKFLVSYFCFIGFKFKFKNYPWFSTGRFLVKGYPTTFDNRYKFGQAWAFEFGYGFMLK